MLPGVSGYENKVREYVKKKVGKKGKIEEDEIGNLIVRIGKPGKPAKKGNRIALIAHMDETGMIVSNILDNGTIKFKKLGGTEDRLLLGRAVEIHTKKGPVLGVIGLRPPHLSLDPKEKDQAITWDKMCIDVGTRTKKETLALGISMLQQITFKKDFFIMNKNLICSKSLDNRVGVTVLLELFSQIDPKKLKSEVIFAWGVQEEIGLRGARVISNTIPLDYAFPIDTYSTTDSPGMGDFFEPLLLGDGPVLRMVDARTIASPKLAEKVAKIAKKQKIPIQYGITGGGTDGMALQEAGASTLPFGIPMRYTHSPVEVVHINDITRLIKLLKAVIYELSG